MCLPSAPSAPAAPPPLPMQAPPPPPAVLEAASGSSPTSTALGNSRGRTSLRIDKTQSLPGDTGSGLNIPT